MKPPAVSDDDEQLDEFVRRLSRPGKPTWKDHEQLLRNPLLRLMAANVGVDLAALDSQYRDVREGAAATLKAAVLFAPFGWTVTGRAPASSAYVEAVRLYEATRDMATVDQCLTKAWADKVWLRGTFGPMTILAGKNDAVLDVLHERNRLLYKALDHHFRGDYEASVLIVLTQIDGLPYDFTEPPYGFFFDARADAFVDDHTVSGLPSVLRAVWKSVIQDPRETSLSGVFQRSPIIHGRQLAFGTETNSVKAFALLAGVIDWLKPIARVRYGEWSP
jgi:hypothetical protein